MPLAIPIGIFVFIFLVVVFCLGFALAFQKSRQNQQIRTMLRTADPVVAERSLDLLRPEGLQSSLGRLLTRYGLASRLDRYLEQAGLNWPASKLVLLTIAAGMAGMLIAVKLWTARFPFLVGAVAPVLFSCLPYFYVRRKRAKRLSNFEKQFPEALDFLARSMRAGHAFSVGLEMLVLDSPEPLSSIFRRVLHDLHLGSSQQDALEKLITLVPVLDVRFFVSSVLLQQETGGNLSEILAKLSGVIRERFQIKGQVRAASAHGKVTGLVLVLMPLAVAVLMLFTSPAYIMILFTDPLGKKLIWAALLGQAIGYLAIKKITDIKV